MLHNIERRLKICYIPENALLNCLSLTPTEPGDVISKLSIDGVPPGTIVMHRSYNVNRQGEAIVLWNKTWPIVPDADLLPEIKVSTTFIQVRGTEPRRESACDQPLIRNAGTFTLERRAADGRVLETVTFENPLTVEPGQELVLVGYINNRSEPIGEARVTGKFLMVDRSDIMSLMNPIPDIPTKARSIGMSESRITISDPKSKIKDPFMEIWEERGGS